MTLAAVTLATLFAGRLVAYNPRGHDPIAGTTASTRSIREDARRLRHRGFRTVTTYASTPTLVRVCRLFKRHGFKRVLVGVADPTDEVELAAAARQRRCADGYVVGNEGLTFGRYGRDALAMAMAWLRASTNRPVTTRETLGEYWKDPTLLGLGDWVFPNVHPYFAGFTEPAAACAWTIARYGELRAGTPASVAVVVAETGLPTAGAPGLDDEVQAAFFTCLEASGIRFVYFEAFDQPWKVALPVEPHWGLFTADGAPKLWAQKEWRRGGIY
jgi:exo-beta-1,3-glucanase (GH17 family)